MVLLRGRSGGSLESALHRRWAFVPGVFRDYHDEKALASFGSATLVSSSLFLPSSHHMGSSTLIHITTDNVKSVFLTPVGGI